MATLLAETSLVFVLEIWIEIMHQFQNKFKNNPTFTVVKQQKDKLEQVGNINLHH